MSIKLILLIFPRKMFSFLYQSGRKNQHRASKVRLSFINKTLVRLYKSLFIQLVPYYVWKNVDFNDNNRAQFQVKSQFEWTRFLIPFILLGKLKIFWWRILKYFLISQNALRCRISVRSFNIYLTIELNIILVT